MTHLSNPIAVHLRRLGRSHQEVADSLFVGGHVGSYRHPRANPVGKYLSSLGFEGALVAPGPKWVWFDGNETRLPRAVRRFLYRFVNGDYPELADEPYDDAHVCPGDVPDSLDHRT